MQTWNAFQLHGKPECIGRKVSFTSANDQTVTGILDEAHAPIGSIYALLVVDGTLYSVSKMTLVEVY